MSTKLNTQVMGGFSKLIKHSKLKKFISFVDRRLFNGKGYIASGFKLIDLKNSSTRRCLIFLATHLYNSTLLFLFNQRLPF